MWRILAGVVAAAFRRQRPGAGNSAQLKAAVGLQTVEGYCGACHSLDYLRTNTPFLNHQGWEIEVNKMIKVFGAPIEPADAKIIIDY